MKKTAYLVNTSRGPIIDEKALLAALNKKQIAGAGLDVFDVEPLPLDHPYRKMDNVVITPHLGYVSQQNYERYYPRHHRRHPRLPGRQAGPRRAATVNADLTRGRRRGERLVSWPKRDAVGSSCRRPHNAK